MMAFAVAFQAGNLFKKEQRTSHLSLNRWKGSSAVHRTTPILHRVLVRIVRLHSGLFLFSLLALVLFAISTTTEAESSGLPTAKETSLIVAQNKSLRSEHPTEFPQASIAPTIEYKNGRLSVIAK
jgi:hypothetical protein